MSHWQLGHEADARSALAKFQQVCGADRWKNDEEANKWRKELDSLIQPNRE